MNFTGQKNPTTIEEIKILEEKMGFVFPEDYKKFILNNNGGKPDVVEFEFLDLYGDDSESLIRVFFSIGKQYSSNVESKYFFFLNEERIPVGFLPIANDPFGNMILLSLLPENHGQIWFWDHELEFEDSNLSCIANDFDSFLQLLHNK